MLTPPQDALEHELANLRRETRLMTTAWCDLSCRLQSNQVVLQRRADLPKSWLGQQRLVVARGPALGAGAARPGALMRSLYVLCLLGFCVCFAPFRGFSVGTGSLRRR